MGNPATPSKACKPCRVKRRKCDMQLPGCSQCWRACIVCPGYRDSFSLRLRDQTKITELKVHDSRTNKDKALSAQAQESQPTYRDATDGNAKEMPNAFALTGLLVHAEDLGHAYFMNLYAPAGSFSYLEISSSISFDLSSLDTALSAPSLLLLSHHLRSPELNLLARAHYAKALTRTNWDLSSPEVAVLDSTMLQVMLLSFFEALVFEGRNVPWDWTTHLDGIVQLIHLRGMSQLDTDFGRALFLHACGNIKTSCAQRSLRLPSHLAVLEQRLASVMDPRDIHLRLGHVLGVFAELRVDGHALSPVERVQAAFLLDERLSGILRDLGRTVPFEVVDVAKIPAKNHSDERPVYRYTSQREARQWSLARVLTLLINDFLFDELYPQQHLDAPLRARQDMTREVVMAKGQSMISDILSSVPYVLELSECPAVSARYIIYPLVCVALSPFSSLDTITFVHGTLGAIASQYGLVQATNSAESILQSKDMESWCVYHNRSSYVPPSDEHN
ncbi:hypothetical protein PG987_001148 [Apiospora arundinis]